MARDQMRKLSGYIAATPAGLKANSIHGLIGFVVPTAALAVAFPLLVHALGETQLGLFVFASSLAGFISVTDFGIAKAVTRRVARSRGAKPIKCLSRTLSTALAFYIVLGLVIAGGIILFSRPIAKSFVGNSAYVGKAQLVLAIYGLQIALSCPTIVFVAMLKGLERFSIAAHIASLQTTLTYGAACLLLPWITVGATLLAVISLLAQAIVLSAAVILAERCLSKDGAAFSTRAISIKHWRYLSKSGAAFTVSALAGALHSQVQRVAVGWVLGPQAVTAYTIGTWGPAKANAAVFAATEPLFPRFAFMHAVRDRRSALLRAQLLYCLAALGFASACLIPIVFFAEPLLRLWFQGKPPAGADIVAQQVAIGLIFNALSQPVHHALNGAGYQWISTRANIASPVVLYGFLLAYFIFTRKIPALGIFGFATMLSLAVPAAVLTLWYFTRFVPKWRAA